MNYNYKNYLPKYELEYVKWNGINFDRERLIKFIKRLKFTKLLSFIKPFGEEYQILNEILQSYDSEIIEGLLQNNETICRMCFIEKWARIGSVDIIFGGSLSRGTYTTISNLPIDDYQMVNKRMEELIHLAQTFTFQSKNLSNEIPGL